MNRKELTRNYLILDKLRKNFVAAKVKHYGATEADGADSIVSEDTASPLIKAKKELIDQIEVIYNG